ncbi:MAG: NUDIX hydrolase [Parcubacteria group bacterium GW2011_GWA2_47_16]|nr:MAG: NUDIX hydrolase [Parcubacteria group bacterium GW2011_GWA2_47_16]
MTDKEFFEQAPKKRVACGVIFFNSKKEILIVKLTYKDGWTLPGGIVEEGESPTKGARREVMEEVGLTLSDPKLLCVDHRYNAADNDDALMLIFFGGILSEKEIENIKLQASELSEHQFATPEQASKLLRHKIGNRTAKALKALATGSIVYLENGEEI